jgi:molybdenum cofactor sulfurtransferase
MQTNLLANPHSDAQNPSTSTVVVAETRHKVLQLFNANPEHFDVVFTANATAAIKLVMECFSGHRDGFDFCFHRNCHTSVVGVREVARRSQCLASDEETEHWLDAHDEKRRWDGNGQPQLFAYSAQSNMNGQRLPLTWAGRVRSNACRANTYTLLDAAAFVSTTPLNLSDHNTAPDFVALSFYKIFGFPDLGALIVRKASAHILDHRKYFGGGTTEMITCFGEKLWAARKEASIHARLEDGTIAIRSILALRCAIDVHWKLFGGMDAVSKHTSWLAKMLHDRLLLIHHYNGVPVCHMYTAPNSRYGDMKTQGATITFNIRKSDGSWVGAYSAGSILRADKIHVRTGSLCNPAGMACALNLSPEDIREAFDTGFRCNQDGDVRESGVLFGMVRVTLGAMSTLADIEALVRCLESRFVDKSCQSDMGEVLSGSSSTETVKGKSPSLLSKDDASYKLDESLQERVWDMRTRRFGCLEFR